MQHSFSFVLAAFAFSALAALEVGNQQARIRLGHHQKIRRNPSPHDDDGFSGQELGSGIDPPETLSSIDPHPTYGSGGISSASFRQEITTISSQFSQYTAYGSSVSMVQISQQFTQCTQAFQTHVSRFESFSQFGGFSDINEYESCVVQFLQILFRFLQFIEDKFSFQAFCQQYSTQWITFQSTFQTFASNCNSHGVHVDRCVTKAGIPRQKLQKFQLENIITGAISSVVKPVTNLLGGVLGGGLLRE